MRTVWKYKIILEREQAIDIPEGAKIVSFHKQGTRHEDDIFIWCLVDTDNPKETRRFFLLETGEPLDGLGDLEYIDTLRFMAGTHVLHLFEKKG